LVNAALVYPALVALVLALAGWGPWPNRDRGARRERGARVAWSSACAWGLGYAAAFHAMWGMPPFPPTEAGHWLLLAMLLAAPIASLECCKGAPRVAYVLLGTSLLAAFVWFASEPLRTHLWSGRAAQWKPAALALGAALHWLLTLDALRRRPSGPLGAIVLALTMGAAAFVLGQSTGASAHVAAGLIGVLVVSGLVAFVRPGREVMWGSALPFSLALAGLLFIGFFFAKVPWTSALLLLAAPQSLRLAGLPSKGWAQYTLSLLVAAAVCGAAAYLGLPADDPYGY
jgi:hypothetical protein